jgi:hypothetical protein
LILAPKKNSNWADIVKKSEAIASLPAEPPTQVETEKKKSKAPKHKKSKEVVQPEPVVVEIVASPPKPAPQPISIAVGSPVTNNTKSPKPPLSPPKNTASFSQYTSPRLEHEAVQQSPVQNTETTASRPPGLAKKQQAQRKPKQDAPVVMPGNNIASGTVGVQFGSFKQEEIAYVYPNLVKKNHPLHN